jgi:hypothetical protein
LNRERPDLSGVDLVVYPICATVHADDDTSVRETPAAQGDTVRTARSFAGQRPVVVSPITIRPRLWPHGDLAGYEGLPFQVDPRQCSLFGAAWTAASLKYISEAGAFSATYYETTGWRGVLEPDNGASRPPAFRSWPGEVFPVYHVLADFGAWRNADARMISSSSSDPLAAVALAARTDVSLHVLVANLQAGKQAVSIGPFGGGRAATRVLDEESFDLASTDPVRFRATRRNGVIRHGRLELELLPYAVACIEVQASP